MSCDEQGMGIENAGRQVLAIDGIDPRVDEYASILRESLKGDFRQFVEFFADPRRLEAMARLLSRHFAGPPGHVLNVGCGPFATEFFAQPLHRHSVVSFDYTRAFAPISSALRARGHVANIRFFIGNVHSAEFAPEKFDLIIMHDLLYEPMLDLSLLFRKYDRFLRPGGLFFLTVLDMRTRLLWKLLGREKPRKRYEIPAVLAEVRACGYQVLDCVPWSLRAAGRLNQVFKQLLWHAFGLANEYAILARKASA